MDPLLLFAALVVTDESRAAFAAAGQPAGRATVRRGTVRQTRLVSLLRPVRRGATAAA